MSEIKHVKESKTYDSNPFTLSFNALGRFFNSNAGWAIAIIVIGVLGFLFQMGSNLAQLAVEGEQGSNSSYSSSSIDTPLEPAVIAAIVIFVLVFILVAVVVGTVLKVYMQGMFSYVALKSEEEKSVGFGEAFEAVTKRFWRLFAAQLLADLKILGWTLLLIVPGIIASLRYSLLPYLIMSEAEQEKGVIDSHTKTKALGKGRLIEVFGVSTVAAIIPVIGSILGLSGKAALFNQLRVFNKEGLEKPKVHWLNYLGLILLAVVMLFVLMIVGIIVLVAISNAS